MRRLSLLFAVVAALLAAGSAAPAGTPTRLQVYEQPFDAGVQPALQARLAVSATAPPTARVVWYVPRGYGLNLGLAPATRLGTGSLTFTGATGASGQGTLATDDPAKHVADPCAPGSHAAVWLLSVALNGQPYVLALYVDPTTGTVATQASYQVQACFEPPSASGRILSQIELDTTNVLSNPSAADNYLWRAIVTPFGAGEIPNPNGGVEAQALVPVPHTVSVKTRYATKTKKLTVSGVALAGRGRDPSTTVGIYTAADLTKPFRRLGFAKTNSRGAFAFSHLFRSSGYIAVVVEDSSYGSDCEPTISSSPCSYETIAASDTVYRKIVVR